MSKIDDLIAKYCPNGVEYKKLVELVKIETGKLNANAMVKGGQYKFFTCSRDVYEIDSYRWDTEAILIAGNGDIGLVHYFVGKFDAYQRTYVLTNFSNIITAKYLHYCLLNGFRNYALAHTKEGSVPYVTLKTIENFNVPVPPLAVQEEIVNILDSFTLLEAELEAELEARRKQYEYYRNKLLTFTPPDRQDLRWCSLGDVATIKGRIGFRGYTRKDLVEAHKGAISLSPSNIQNGILNLESCTYISWAKYEESPEIMAEVGDIIFTKTASVGKTALIKSLTEKATINPQLVLLKELKCDALYLTHVMQASSFQNEVRKITGIGSVPNVPQRALAEIKIPLPPIAEQRRIAAILDNFEALTNSLQDGLPAEIAARRQQYEYYRDKLLTFPRKTA